MFDKLYENIGDKIKGWAKWIFIIEAIGAIITGLVLFSQAVYDDDFVLYGLLTIIFGPVCAYVGSWILYAFGELVEKTSENEYNTRQILIKLYDELGNTENYTANYTENHTENYTENYKKTTNSPKTESAYVPSEKWNSAYASQGTCEMCGKKKCPVIFAEFEDFFGRGQKNMCYDCYSKRASSPQHKI